MFARRIVGIVPARGGSKRLPRKNIAPLAGRPLLAWSVDAGLQARSVDRLIVSSDDTEILDVGARAGAEVHQRPPALACDRTRNIDVVRHLLEAGLEADVVVLLQPTSPLRTADDVDGCVARLLESEAPSCVTVTSARQDDRVLCHLTDGKIRRVYEATGGTPLYRLNGAVYAIRADHLRGGGDAVCGRTIPYVMPEERSVDVDTAADLDRARRQFERRAAG